MRGEQKEAATGKPGGSVMIMAREGEFVTAGMGVGSSLAAAAPGMTGQSRL